MRNLHTRVAIKNNTMHVLTKTSWHCICIHVACIHKYKTVCKTYFYHCRFCQGRICAGGALMVQHGQLTLRHQEKPSEKPKQVFVTLEQNS